MLGGLIFGRGQFLPKQTGLIDAGAAIVAKEKVRCTVNARKLRVPSAAGFTITGYRGAVVVTKQHIVATVGRDYTLISLPMGPITGDAPAWAQLDSSGLHVHFDVPRIVEGGRGKVWFDYKLPLTATDFDRLSMSTAPVWIKPENFLALCGRWIGH